MLPIKGLLAHQDEAEKSSCGSCCILQSLDTCLQLFETLCLAVQDRLASGEQIFGPLLQKYILQNPHKVSARVLPDKELGANQDEAEKAKLEQRSKAMSPSDLEAAIKETAELKERQVQYMPDQKPVHQHSKSLGRGREGQAEAALQGHEPQ